MRDLLDKEPAWLLYLGGLSDFPWEPPLSAPRPEMVVSHLSGKLFDLIADSCFGKSKSASFVDMLRLFEDEHAIHFVGALELPNLLDKPGLQDVIRNVAETENLEFNKDTLEVAAFYCKEKNVAKVAVGAFCRKWPDSNTWAWTSEELDGLCFSDYVDEASKLLFMQKVADGVSLYFVSIRIDPGPRDYLSVSALQLPSATHQHLGSVSKINLTPTATDFSLGKVTAVSVLPLTGLVIAGHENGHLVFGGRRAALMTANVRIPEGGRCFALMLMRKRAWSCLGMPTNMLSF